MLYKHSEQLFSVFLFLNNYLPLRFQIHPQIMGNQKGCNFPTGKERFLKKGNSISNDRPMDIFLTFNLTSVFSTLYRFFQRKLPKRGNQYNCPKRGSN